MTETEMARAFSPDVKGVSLLEKMELWFKYYRHVRSPQNHLPKD